MPPADLHHDEESFEFSFRPGYGARLFVSVPGASLDVLRRDGGATMTSLSLVNRHAAAICALALVRSQSDHTTAIVVTEADAESILAGAGSAALPGSA